MAMDYYNLKNLQQMLWKMRAFFSPGLRAMDSKEGYFRWGHWDAHPPKKYLVI